MLTTAHVYLVTPRTQSVKAKGEPIFDNWYINWLTLTR